MSFSEHDCLWPFCTPLVAGLWFGHEDWVPVGGGKARGSWLEMWMTASTAFLVNGQEDDIGPGSFLGPFTYILTWLP